MSAVRVWRETLDGVVEVKALYPGHQGYVLVEDYQSAVAVMAQMAEALRKIVGCEENRARDLRHRESWVQVKFSEERMLKAQAALSAYQSLGEQS